MDLLGVLFPRTCPLCKTIIVGIYICNDCKKELPYIIGPRCFKCGKPVLAEEKEYCGDCNRKKHKYKKGLTPFLHIGKLKDSIYRIKYENKREYIDFFVDEIIKLHEKEIMSWQCDLIVPVPLYKNKKIKRGFNQAEVLASRLSKKLSIPYVNALSRINDTLPQKQLNNTQRKKNLEKAFKINKNIVELNRVIIVDDIYTTGSTIDECSKILLAHGAEEVYFICLSIGTGY